MWVKRTCRASPDTSVFDPGCVKTRLGEGCAELFSQLPSSERSCQYNRLPHRRNRDGSSTRKLDIGVFTQPRPEADLTVPSYFTRLNTTSSVVPGNKPGLVNFNSLSVSEVMVRFSVGSPT